MSIRPIDFQLSVPRSVEVSRNKEEEHQKDLSAQQNQMNNATEKADNSLRQVQRHTQAENVSIKEKEEREKRKNKDAQKKQNEDKEDTSSEKEENTSPIMHLDIRI